MPDRIQLTATWAEYLTEYEALFGVISVVLAHYEASADCRCRTSHREGLQRLRERLVPLLPLRIPATVEYGRSLCDLNAQRLQILLTLPAAVEMALAEVLGEPPYTSSRGFDLTVTLLGRQSTAAPGTAPFTFGGQMPIGAIRLPCSSPRLTLTYTWEKEQQQ